MNMDFQTALVKRLTAIYSTEKSVLFGNVRDLQASEIAPRVVTPLPFNQALLITCFRQGMPMLLPIHH